MTISRPARRRWPVAAGAATAGAALGLVIGLAVAGGGDTADPEQALRDTRATLTEAVAALDVAQVEYAESVRNGTVVRQPEYGGARSAVRRSRSLYLEARAAVVLIDSRTAREIDAGYAALTRAMAAGAPAQEVGRMIRELRRSLEQPVGLRVAAG